MTACSLRAYRSFAAIFHTGTMLNIAISHSPIKLELRIMLLMAYSYYPQNYAGIIGGSLPSSETEERPKTSSVHCCKDLLFCSHILRYYHVCS